jgi:cytochrome c-type biogenesis protein CcmH
MPFAQRGAGMGMTLKRLMMKTAVLLALWSVASLALAVIETYEFDNDAQHARYQHFIEILRCPKCQNENLAGSNSPIAADLRHELVRQIKAGKQDAEIVNFMVARYGDFVLYDPRFKKNTLLLWLAPGLLLLAGVLLVWFVLRRQPRVTVATNKDELELSSANHPSDMPVELQVSLPSRQVAVLVLVLSLVFVGIGTGLLYLRLGAAEQLKISNATEKFYAEMQQASTQNRAPDLARGRELVALLVPYLQKHPDDINLAYVLGSTYVQLSEFEQAVPWYKQYLMAVPEDERVLTEYVQLLYLNAHQQLTDRVLFVVDRALTLNPHNQDVLGLMAMHYHQAGQYAEAAGYWQRMLETLTPGSEVYQSVEKALAEARLRAAQK